MRIFLVTLLILGVVFIGGLVLTGNKMQQNGQFQPGIGGGPGETRNTTDDITIQQRTQLHRLLQEHAVTAGLHLQNLYDDQNTQDTAGSLEENTQKLITLMDEISNEDSVDEFANIWRQHIRDYENYTLALKANNSSQLQQIRNTLQMHSEEFGNTINSLFPEVSADNASEAMNEHMTLTLSVVEAHAENNAIEKTAQAARASAQAASFAETLIP